jgi:hypothetical protein
MSSKTACLPTAEDLEAFETVRCEIPTTCQPPSAWCKEPWPAVIRNVFPSGLSLTLQRRFEKGSGLAIELPGIDGGSSTVLARVTHIQSFEAGSWLLGCRFISELSDEEVQFVLDRDPGRLVKGEPTAEQTVIEAVIFQVRLPSGQIGRWIVRHLENFGQWPLLRNCVVVLQIPGLSGPLGDIELKVKNCRRFRSYWVVDSTFQHLPSPEILARLTR